MSVQLSITELPAAEMDGVKLNNRYRVMMLSLDLPAAELRQMASRIAAEGDYEIAELKHECRKIEQEAAAVALAPKMTNARHHGCAFDGWQCFHCGEIFTTIGGAHDHFGAKPDAVPGCMLKVALGDERGLLMELRKAEARLAAIEAAPTVAKVSLYHGVVRVSGSELPPIGTELIARPAKD